MFDRLRLANAPDHRHGSNLDKVSGPRQADETVVDDESSTDIERAKADGAMPVAATAEVIDVTPGVAETIQQSTLEAPIVTIDESGYAKSSEQRSSSDGLDSTTA